jgi:hypothetical protein
MLQPDTDSSALRVPTPCPQRAVRMADHGNQRALTGTLPLGRRSAFPQVINEHRQSGRLDGACQRPIRRASPAQLRGRQRELRRARRVGGVCGPRCTVSTQIPCMPAAQIRGIAVVWSRLTDMSGGAGGDRTSRLRDWGRHLVFGGRQDSVRVTDRHGLPLAPGGHGSVAKHSELFSQVKCHLV